MLETEEKSVQISTIKKVQIKCNGISFFIFRQANIPLLLTFTSILLPLFTVKRNPDKTIKIETPNALNPLGITKQWPRKMNRNAIVLNA